MINNMQIKNLQKKNCFLPFALRGAPLWRELEGCAKKIKKKLNFIRTDPLRRRLSTSSDLASYGAQASMFTPELRSAEGAQQSCFPQDEPRVTSFSFNSVFIFCLISFPSLYSFDYVDFDTSMQTAVYQHITRAHQSAILAMNFFKKLYEKNNPSLIQVQETLKIPKIIHQIWLGKKMPEEYIPFRKSWITYHPEWTFIFWTDNPVNYEQGQVLIESFEALNHYLNNNGSCKFLVVNVKKLAFANRGFYDVALNYGEKSDILKWEIVYRFGGLYVDTDFECLKPLDQMHYMYDFYTGIQPLDTNMVQLGAALYAAYPGHPILKQCVDGIKENQHISQIITKTGPIHFTKSFFRTAMSDKDINIALPATYFYPCGYAQQGMHQSVWRRAESYAIHHWAGSWLKPEAFEQKK